MFRTRAVVAVALAVLSLAAPRPAAAASVQLSLSTASISFPDANPELVPQIVSTPTPVSVTIQVAGNPGAWQLTVAATGDLQSGADTIPVGNISWTSSVGAPWLPGSLAVVPPQTVAAGTGNLTPAQTSNLTFRIANLWTFAAGVYTTTATFTLFAP
jgi:hypothetical protein